MIFQFFNAKFSTKSAKTMSSVHNMIDTNQAFTYNPSSAQPLDMPLPLCLLLHLALTVH